MRIQNLVQDQVRLAPIAESHPNKQEGQSIIEIAFTLPLLLMIVLALFEMGVVFGSYISLANATREGAIFASMHPELTNPANDNNTYGGGTRTLWQEYFKRVNDEIVVLVSEPLREGQLLDEGTLTVNRPVLGPAPGPNCPGTNPMNPGCPITVTVSFRLHTFVSDASLPVVGRLGLPNYYQITYSVGMPIR